MGRYINETSKGEPLPRTGKANALINDGAKIVQPNKFQENLICVIENGFFDAAGYAFSENEFKAFKHPDGRNKIWLVHPLAKKLAK